MDQMQQQSLSTQLFDLNADCLREVFLYLDQYDYVNLAEAFELSKNEHDHHAYQLEKSKRDNFKDELYAAFMKKKNGQLDNIASCFCRETHKELRLMNAMLQHFGHLLTSVTISYCECCSYFAAFVERNVWQYCRESLQAITLGVFGKYAMFDISGNFPNVRKLELYHGFLGQRLSRFNSLFPGLKDLSLIQLTIDDPKCIEDHFPFLEHLEIKNPKDIRETIDRKKYVTNQNLRIAIQLNPQLKSLNLTHDDSKQFSDENGLRLNDHLFLYINRKLPELKKLKVVLCDENWWEHKKLSYNGLTCLDFRSLESVHIDVSSMKILKHLRIGGKKVTEFKLEIFDAEDWRVEWKYVCKLLERSPNITQLWIDDAFIADDRFRSFTELRYKVLSILRTHQTLRKITCSTVFRRYHELWENNPEYEQMIRGLPSTWKITQSSGILSIEK